MVKILFLTLICQELQLIYPDTCIKENLIPKDILNFTPLHIKKIANSINRKLF